MRVLAGMLCLIAVVALVAATRDMALHTGSPRRGLILRAIALVAFAAAVILNVAQT